MSGPVRSWLSQPTPYTGHRYRGLRIGILGGSFNPAHEGHLHISLIALRRLGLDQIWWLVTPQNPLKTRDEMAPLKARQGSARAQARHPRIVATQLEDRLGTRFTADSLAAVRRRFRGAQLVWLMGADNLVQIPAWDRWEEIFERGAVVALARPPYSPSMLSGQAARRFARNRVASPQAMRARVSAGRAGWCFLHIPLRAISATALRAAGARLSQGAHPA